MKKNANSICINPEKHQLHVLRHINMNPHNQIFKNKITKQKTTNKQQQQTEKKQKKKKKQQYTRQRLRHF